MVVAFFCLLNSSPLAFILHITTSAPFLLCRQPAISSSKSRTGSDGENEMSREASGGFEPPRERRRRKREKAATQWEANTQEKMLTFGKLFVVSASCSVKRMPKYEMLQEMEAGFVRKLYLPV